MRLEQLHTLPGVILLTFGTYLQLNHSVIIVLQEN